jgi:hypothetical protein
MPGNAEGRPGEEATDPKENLNRAPTIAELREILARLQALIEAVAEGAGDPAPRPRSDEARAATELRGAALTVAGHLLHDGNQPDAGWLAACLWDLRDLLEVADREGWFTR